jgi:hypothetical protein
MRWVHHYTVIGRCSRTASRRIPPQRKQALDEARACSPVAALTRGRDKSGKPLHSHDPSRKFSKPFLAKTMKSLHNEEKNGASCGATMLLEIAHMKKNCARKSARGGRALLTGLMRCGRCGRMMRVFYGSARRLWLISLHPPSFRLLNCG